MDLDNLSWIGRLDAVSSSGRKAVFSTSFSIEDQIITHIIAEQKLNIDIFTIDTGMLFKQTYKLFQDTLSRYSIEIKTYYPANEELERFVSAKGPLSFYTSRENRLECCSIRKVMPLKKALSGYNIWISGLRKAHSSYRTNKSVVEQDANMLKVYPVLELSDKDVWAFIRENKVPYNSLYDEGFLSIGCEPCTRAVINKDNPREGRWWWESGDDKRECGLHFNSKKVV